jgi:NarL family two-component system response regulator LiaR
MKDVIRLVLVDDHRVVRRGLCSYLEAFPDIIIVGEASSGEQALEQIESWLPDVVIMDLLMPGGIDGIETTRRIRTITPHTQVVVLTAYTDDARVVGALRAGAIGYVRKDAEPEILLAAVRAAARGQSMLDPAIKTHVGNILAKLHIAHRTQAVIHALKQGLISLDEIEL